MKYYVFSFFNSFCLLWLQDPNSSSLLFRLAPPGMNMMSYASVRHSLHILDVGLYEGALVIISQLISCWIFLAFRLQTWLASFDAVFLFSLMSELCLLYLVLNRPLAHYLVLNRSPVTKVRTFYKNLVQHCRR